MKSKRYIMTGALTLSLLAVVSASALYINNKIDSKQFADIPESSKIIENDIDNNMSEVLNIVENNESSVEVVKDKEVIDITESEEVYAELTIHCNEVPVYSFDEIDEIINRGTEAYNNNITNKIDIEKYVGNVEGINVLSDDEINTIENKSLIYHLMLNSIDYYNTAEGEVIDSRNMEYPIFLEYQTNIQDQYAYCLSSQDGQKVCEDFIEDFKHYTVHCENNTYTMAYIAEPVEYTISDNDRYVTLSDDGEHLSVYRNDLTNLGHAASVCIFPQGMAFKYVSDFDLWNISGKESLLGRNCFVIEGNIKNSDETFKMYIDDCTGILLKYESYSNLGEITGFVETKSIKIDEPMTKKIFDASDYTETPLSLNEEVNNIDEIQN